MLTEAQKKFLDRIRQDRQIPAEVWEAVQKLLLDTHSLDDDGLVFTALVAALLRAPTVEGSEASPYRVGGVVAP